jgi:hypothetical protein
MQFVIFLLLFCMLRLNCLILLLPRNAQKEQENSSVASIDKRKTMQHVHFSCQIMQICKTDTPRNCSDLTSTKKSVRKDL